MRSSTLLLLLVCLLFLPHGLRGEDEEIPDDPGNEFILKGDKQTLESPPLQIKRPNDSWQFLNVELLNKKALERARNQGSGMNAPDPRMKFRLWYGARRANIVIHVSVSPREVQAVDLCTRYVEAITKRGGKFTSPKKVKVGRFAGVMVEGQVKSQSSAQKDPAAIFKAFAVRPDDKAVLEVFMECKKKDAKELKKDFKKLLKKAKF